MEGGAGSVPEIFGAIRLGEDLGLPSSLAAGHFLAIVCQKPVFSPLALHKLVVGFFAALARYSIHHPKRVVFIAVFFTLAIAPGALRLTLRTDGHALVSETA